MTHQAVKLLTHGKNFLYQLTYFGELSVKTRCKTAIKYRASDLYLLGGIFQCLCLVVQIFCPWYNLFLNQYKNNYVLTQYKVFELVQNVSPVQTAPMVLVSGVISYFSRLLHVHLE